MAMTVGEVEINHGTGDATGSGAAKELFDDFDAKQDYQGLSGEALAGARQAVADLCNSFAKILNHITANAEVATTIDSGSEAIGVTTGGSNVDVTGTTSGGIS